MSAITTHVLDTSVGRPAAGIAVHLERQDGDGWNTVGRADTDADGRVRALVPEGTEVSRGIFRLTFETAPYFARTQTPAFYPYVTVVFEVADNRHYHVPLLISPFGYSTYRGS